MRWTSNQHCLIKVWNNNSSDRVFRHQIILCSSMFYNQSNILRDFKINVNLIWLKIRIFCFRILEKLDLHLNLIRKDEKMLLGYLAGYHELRSYIQVLVWPSAKGKRKECGRGWWISMNELKGGRIKLKIDIEGGVYRISVMNRELSYVSSNLSGAL